MKRILADNPYKLVLSGQDGMREYAARKAAMLFAAETPERRLRHILGLFSAAEARDLCRHVRRRK